MQPCDKNCYPDKKAAVSALNRIMRRRKNRPKQLSVYYCEECKAHHLTSRKE